MERYPNVTLKLIIKSDNGVLLLRRKDSVYEFPGGRMRFLETIEEALAREIKEELGIALSASPRLFHVWNFISKNKRRHSVMIYFICNAKKEDQYSVPKNMQAVWVKSRKMRTIVSDNDFVDSMFRWKNERR
ncbi:MAG: NUDIX hydrolase [Candidatus Uhrbacteria bacterium]|nr:NUDIX hydrolase [Candidatus Uhrbacteria bacterium]